tara:strand:+ start:11011 stop:12012 length:1002 start_codon:yes stop_codon:yes gene_type:complete
MKKKPTKIVELVIEENNEMLAIDAISLVSAPAIEQDFVFFGKEKHNLTFAKVDEEKRMLVSPALIPNKQIFRYDPNTDSEYYVYFSKDTVRKASELYLKHNNHHKATYEHNERVSGVLTTESWIKEGDQDKSKMYGYDLPNGTWFVKMRIDNDDLWQKIKDGELKGLSIEGYFVDKMQKMSETQPTDQEILTALNEIIQESNKPQKVELGIIDDLKKDVEKARKEVESAERLHKAAEKDNNEVNKLSGQYIDLKAKADKKRKDMKGLIDFSKEKIKESKSLLSKSKKTASTIEKQLKDLGLDNKVISSQLSEIDKLNSTLKSLDFGFINDLPF